MCNLIRECPTKCSKGSNKQKSELWKMDLNLLFIKSIGQIRPCLLCSSWPQNTRFRNRQFKLQTASTMRTFISLAKFWSHSQIRKYWTNQLLSKSQRKKFLVKKRKPKIWEEYRSKSFPSKFAKFNLKLEKWSRNTKSEVMVYFMSMIYKVWVRKTLKLKLNIILSKPKEISNKHSSATSMILKFKLDSSWKIYRAKRNSQLIKKVKLLSRRRVKKIRIVIFSEKNII